MSFLDQLAEDNANIVKLDKVASIDDELRSMLSSTFEVNENEGHSKTAFYSTFGRIDQSADTDMHQEDETPDVWIQKQGKLIRIAPEITNK